MTEAEVKKKEETRVLRRVETRWHFQYAIKNEVQTPDMKGDLYDTLASVTLRKEKDDTYSVWDLMVPYKHRRKGNAKKMMRYVEKFVRAEGGKLIWLRVKWTNWTAVLFYHHLSYSPIKNVRREEDGKLLLAKKL